MKFSSFKLVASLNDLQLIKHTLCIVSIDKFIALQEGESTVTFDKAAFDAVGDQSDNALLRSRIDEQGQLICFLKQRADENMMRNKVETLGFFLLFIKLNLCVFS